MFRRFTASARSAVTLAQDEAARRGDRRVGTEHLLLGLLNDRRSPAVQALGVDLAQARRALRDLDREALSAVGVDVEADADEGCVRTPGHLPLTSAARDALADTLRVAARSRDRTLEPRHLALALLGAAPPDGAALLLDRLRVDRAAVVARLVAAA